MAQIEPCQNIRPWDWKLGIDTHEEIYGPVHIFRNYFDCGIYFFDGTFNVVKFPAGMTIYHGSAVLADNVVAFPVGVPYYDKTGPNVPVNMNLITTGNESIEAVISENFPITAGWYGDFNAARIYSAAENNPADTRLANVCQDRCVFAFKLTKDVVFFLLDDEYNIGKLMYTNDAVFPAEQKDHLAHMYELRNLNIEEGDRFNRIKFVDRKNRISFRDHDIPFSTWMCHNMIGGLGYAGLAAGNQHTIHHGGVFHLEFIFCNAFKWMERDLTNIHDWQHFRDIPNPAIATYINQLKLYESANVNWHAGDLLEHSVWTLLWTEDIIEGVGDFAVLSMADETDDTKRVIAFSAFIHDIGKVEPLRERNRGDEVYNPHTGKYIYNSIREHPQYGRDYIMGARRFPIMGPNNTRIGSLNIDDLFAGFGVDLTDRVAVATIVEFHWEFGIILRDLNSGRDSAYIQRSINTFLDNIITASGARRNKILFIKIVQAVLIVSIADIKATQPYGVGRLYREGPDQANLNKSSTFFPYITNMPKEYKGGNISETSRLIPVGVDLAVDILNIANARVFL